MRQVSAEIRQRVLAKVDECREVIAKRFGIPIPAINIRYDINARRLNGEARPVENVVRINPVYLNAHTDKYLATTLPHEVAHIAVYQVYHLHFGRRHTQAHGSEWRGMMAVLGIPADRCNHYDTPEGVQHGKPKAKFNYRCSGCHEIVVVGPKHHRSLQDGAEIYHRPCGRHSRLVFVTEAGRVTYTEARQQGANPLPAAPKPQAPATPVLKPSRAGSKIDQCYHWYLHYLDNVPDGWTLRQICISVFMQEVDMSAAGASTYYNTCQKKYEQDR